MSRISRFGPLLALAAVALVPAASALSFAIDTRIDLSGIAAPAPLGVVEAHIALPHALARAEALDLATPLASISIATSAPTSGDDAGPAAPSASLESASAAPVAPIAPVLASDASAPAAALAIVTLVGFALYSRIAKSDVLHLEARDRVFKLISDEPGVGMLDVSRRLDLGWGTTVYHLDRLERAGLVASEHAGNARRFYAVGRVAPNERRERALLFGGTGRFAHAVLARPGAPQGELARDLGLTPGAVAKQVAALEAAGLVRRERDGRTAHCYPTEMLVALAAPVASLPASEPPSAA